MSHIEQNQVDQQGHGQDQSEGPRRGWRCPICSRGDAAEVNRLLEGGARIRDVADKLGTNKTAVGNHRKHCLKLDTKQEPSVTSPALQTDPSSAQTFEQRADVCADIIATGQWRGRRTVRWLMGVWGCQRATVAQYRRAGALMARQDRCEEVAEQTEETLGGLMEDHDKLQEVADKLEAGGDYANAARYRLLAQKARIEHAKVAGVVQTRVSVSLEADPRFAGLWTELVDEIDRLNDELLVFQGQVEKLTGGVLPEAPLPNLRERIVARVRGYEARLGARSAA